MTANLPTIILGLIVWVSVGFVFKKAGRPIWTALIPFYNQWSIYEIAGTTPWWSLFYNLPFLALLLLISRMPKNSSVSEIGEVGLGVSIILLVIGAVLYAITCVKLAEKFNRSRAFGFFLLFGLSFIGWPMLAFGKDKYLNKKYKNTKNESNNSID